MKRIPTQLFFILFAASTLSVSHAADAETSTKARNDVAGQLAARAQDASAMRNRQTSPAESNEKQGELATRIGQLQIDRRPSAVLKTWELEHARQDQALKSGPGKAATSQEEDVRLEKLAIDATLSRWEDVAHFFSGLSTEESLPAYHAFLEALKTPPAQGRPPVEQQIANNPNYKKYASENSFAVSDVLGLIDAAPADFTPSTTERLAPILQLSIQQGHAIETFASTFAQQSESDSRFRMSRKEVARLFNLAGQANRSGTFLPSAAEIVKSDDHELQMLYVEFLLADKSHSPSVAWDVLQAILNNERLPNDVELSAIGYCIDLMPEISAEAGREWLERSFQGDPGRGFAILSTLGAAVSDGYIPDAGNYEKRSKRLELQCLAVKTLLDAVADRGDFDRSMLEPIVTLLAENWMQEARIAYDLAEGGAVGPRLHRDRYGNAYFVDEQYDNARNGRAAGAGPLKPISIQLLLASAPSERWRERISPSQRPYLLALIARMHLKAADEAGAFPYIEQLAQLMPPQARELVDESMRVWIANHDLNSHNRPSQVYLAYGYQPRSNAIPLTRSQQQRNLRELSKWLERLDSLPLEPVDEGLVLEAFTRCHSVAEVYQLSAIEDVLGNVDDLKPETIAKIANKMQTNLSGVWRDPEVQQEYKTNRKGGDLELEVSRGYDLAYDLIERSLANHPDSWRLKLAFAALLHDQNEYLREMNQGHNYEAQRRRAFEEFHKAAVAYQAEVDELEPEKYSPDVFEFWFLAALGSCNVRNIDETNRLAPDQVEAIILALNSLTPEAKSRHEELFANHLFQTLSGVKPNVKYRYLRAGLEIIGDQPLASEARDIFKYYQDLVSEIQLDVQLDGADKLSCEQPFGIYVSIRHTIDIERESGGFSKYLQNQNQMANAFNYGRPTENYRDKFEESVRTALEEHFDVLSVTFQKAKIRSMADSEVGWRRTPYAFVLLKAKGPQVDMVPSFSLDMDFIDKSGYVVLPIESRRIPIDAKSEQYIARPVDDVQVIQTLDDSELEKGVATVEVKVNGHGVLPPVGRLLDLSFAGFEVAEVQSYPLSVVEFDAEATENVVCCERLAKVSLRSVDSQPSPDNFTFAKVKDSSVPVAMTYQRFDDANISLVDSTIDLGDVETGSRSIYYWVVGACALFAAIVAMAILYLRPSPPVSEDLLPADPPVELTPFSALDYLRRLDRSMELSEIGRLELNQEIASIEAAFFGTNGSGSTDLGATVEKWLQRSRKGSLG